MNTSSFQRRRPGSAVRLLAVLLLALLTSACSVQKSPITGNRRAYAWSWEQELRLGEEADRQIQQQYGVYPDEEIQDYVDRVGRSMLEVSHMRREDSQQKYRETEFTFRVLDSPVVNAFALPGGYVYVTRGLLAHLENEAQLAVVLGHEIGHVAARHASQRALEQQVGQLALLGGAIAGQELLGVPGGDILAAGSQAAQFLFLSYSREDERESDALGVEYAARQRYEAAEGADFFTTLQRISAQSGHSLPTFQSTHPDPAVRAETIPELARDWAEQGYPQEVIEREDYLRRLEGLVYGENPREGFSREGVFYHPDLAFRFDRPDDWQLINQRNLVAAVSPEEDAVTLLQIDSEHDSPRASVEAFLNQEGITVLDQSQDSQHGLTAYEAEASADTQEGNQVRYRVRAVAYGDLIYRFTSYTYAERYGRYEQTFGRTASSFRELDNPDILAIRPLRLEVRPAQREGDLAALLPQPLPGEVTLEEIAILNQVEDGQVIAEGTLLKVPAGGR
ncbi:MAG: M48 family metalloprotease [Balneolaceae bacterium]|nr:M48 family metalloprotease [Balneolaceae bacterium]